MVFIGSFESRPSSYFQLVRLLQFAQRAMSRAVALLIFLLAVPACYATDYVVGGTTGWDTSGDYTTWASGKTFSVGDSLCKLTYFPSFMPKEKPCQVSRMEGENFPGSKT